MNGFDITQAMNEVKNYDISDNTARLVACLKVKDAMYSAIWDTLADVYSDECASVLTQRDYADAFEALEKAIFNSLMDIMSENLCETRGHSL